VQKHRLNPMPLLTQKFLLAQSFPAKRCFINGNTLVWEGCVAPSAIGRKYDLRVEYVWRGVPKIFVTRPNLRDTADAVISGRDLPHVYSQEPVRLCVYLPGCGEWHSSKAIAVTVIPWSIAWLGFFEDWVFTNVWSGGGIHRAVKHDEEGPAPKGD
jgi:hypothetical protein